MTEVLKNGMYFYFLVETSEPEEGSNSVSEKVSISKQSCSQFSHHGHCIDDNRK